MKNYQEISINDIKGIKIGHFDDAVNGTGVSVILPDEKAICGVDIRGGGPASIETVLLDPLKSNDGINALFLSGGSAYGLDVAGGIMKYLEEKGKGVKVGDAIVPIVVGSCIFDLGVGNGKVRPDGEMGYKACLDAEKNLPRCGNAGGGMGATVGKMKGDKYAMKSGLGTFALKVGKLEVGAIVIVNAIGNVYEIDSDKPLAGLLDNKKEHIIDCEDEALKLLQLMNTFGLNTTIGAIITNAKLDKASMNKVAAMASNGLARTIRPVNMSMDGDSVYAMCTGKVKSSADVIGTMASFAMAKAINNAVMSADDLFGYKSYKSLL